MIKFKQVRPSDQLKYTVVRIRTANDYSQIWTGTGTGFFYTYELDQGMEACVILTNKHVIADALMLSVTMHVQGDDGAPLQGPGHELVLPVMPLKIFHHPDPDVDLVAINIREALDDYQSKNHIRFYLVSFRPTHLPTPQSQSEMSSIEEVLMAGYPIGIMDNANNYPIIRKGLTATPYQSNYEGSSQFLVDIPVFGGSSGSPIVLLDEGVFYTGEAVHTGVRTALLGYLHSGFDYNVEGKLEAKEVPTALQQTVVVTSGMNLGLCHHSRTIEDIKFEIFRYMQMQGKIKRQKPWLSVDDQSYSGFNKSIAP